MLALLAPSKTQATPPQSGYEFGYEQPLFLNRAIESNQVLRNLSDDDLQKIMKISDKLLVATKEKINSFQTPFTAENSSPAIFTFQGDSYDSIEPANWSKEQFSYAQEHLATLSGQYGILRPLDLMQAYRLEMGLKLENDHGKNMYQFWGDMITDKLNEILLKHDDKRIISLASNEYMKVINKKKLQGEIIEIVFKQEKAGKYKTIPIYAKRARGAMANFIVENMLNCADELRGFSEGGYRYVEDESDGGAWVFRCNVD